MTARLHPYLRGPQVLGRIPLGQTTAPAPATTLTPSATTPPRGGGRLLPSWVHLLFGGALVGVGAYSALAKGKRSTVQCLASAGSIAGGLFIGADALGLRL